MKNILVFLLFTLPLFSNSQNIVKIKHTNFKTSFDTVLRYPVVVEWWLTKKLISCRTPLKRKDTFKPDPTLLNSTDLSKDYIGSGYDRGHMMPAADNLCQTQKVQDECFYFTNISAQTHRLNAGDWKSLETYVRNEALKFDSIKVWAGNFGQIRKIGRVSVPEKCWKVIYFKNIKKFKAYIFENDHTPPNGFEDNEISMSEIQKLTKLKFVE